MKKKIAIIIERANVSLGGAERSVFELADALSALGLEVNVLVAKGQAKTRNIHILCKDQPGKRTGYFTFAGALKKYLAENHHDIVHSTLPFDFADVYQPRGGSFAEAALRNAASYQNKLVESCKRITAFANLRRTILLHAEKKLCKNPAGPTIAALSHYVAGHFKKHYGLDDNRIVVIPNGVKINTQPDTKQADKLRTQILLKLGLKEADNPVFFLFVANNFRLKGLSPLIKAMSVYSAETDKVSARPAYLIVAGSNKTRRYRLLAKKLGVSKKILFLGLLGHIQNVLSITDVAVLPTFYDPSSRFILEALAADRPVITTKFNGAGEQFIDGRHGKIIDRPENVPALAQAIRHFTSTDNICKASQAIVEDNIKEKISITRVAEQLDSLYDEILEKRKNKRMKSDTEGNKDR